MPSMTTRVLNGMRRSMTATMPGCGHLPELVRLPVSQYMVTSWTPPDATGALRAARRCVGLGEGASDRERDARDGLATGTACRGAGPAARSTGEGRPAAPRGSTCRGACELQEAARTASTTRRMRMTVRSL